MTDFCLPDADQDIENARRTTQTMIYSGTWDPTVNNTEAQAGTLFLGVGSDPNVRGKSWQKLDDGCNTNWTPLAAGSGSSSLEYRYERYVDPVIGDDTSGDGSINKPFKTIAACLASITDASNTNRYVIRAAQGNYPEPLITWKDNVSLIGTSANGTLIGNGITYTAPAGSTATMVFQGVRIAGAGFFTIDSSLGINVNIRVIHCLAIVEYNGGPDYPVTQSNNLFFIGTTLGSLTVIDGHVACYDNSDILFGLDIQDGPAVNSVPFVELCAGFVQGAITLAGKGQLISRGVYNIASVTGTIASGVTPQWFLDGSSQTTGVVSGDLKQIFQDQQLASVATTPYTITKESILLVDATAADEVILLPKAANYVNRAIKVKKVDASANYVKLRPDGLEEIDGVNADFSFNKENQCVEVVSDGTSWSIVGAARDIDVLSSDASAGGAGTEALTVTGLLATDVILAVTQRVPGANSTAVIGHGAPGAGSLSVTWTADPGAGAIVDVLIKRSPL